MIRVLYPRRRHGGWSDSEVVLLRAGIDNGMTCTAIGIRLRRSKNAVVGKAHRLGLNWSKHNNRADVLYKNRESYAQGIKDP